MNNWGLVDPNFLMHVQLLVNTVLHNCFWLVPAFMLMGLTVAMIRAVFTNGSMMIDPGFLLRGIIIWFLLFNYLEIIDIITGAIEGFAGLIPKPNGILDDLNQFATSTVTAAKEGPDPNASVTDRMMFYIQGAFNFRVGLQYWLSSLFEQGLTMFIRICYEKLRAMLLAFLTVVGPLSLTLSVFPGMEKVASHWFKGWFVVHMWSVTLRVLDSIIHNYNEAVFSQAGNSPSILMDSIIINSVCVLMYLLVPSLTTYFVGHAASSGFFSKLAGVVSTVASVASFGAGAAAKLAGSSAGSATAAGSVGSGSASSSYGGAGFGSPVGPNSPMMPPGGGYMLGTGSPLALPPGGGHLLGGGTPIGPPPGGSPLPPLSGGNIASIPVRQLPVSPQPKPVPIELPQYASYEIV